MKNNSGSSSFHEHHDGRGFLLLAGILLCAVGTVMVPVSCWLSRIMWPQPANPQPPNRNRRIAIGGVVMTSIFAGYKLTQIYHSSNEPHP